MPKQVVSDRSSRNIRQLMGSKSLVKTENSKLEASDQSDNSPDIQVCLICKNKIKISSAERQLSDLKFHYTKCYWEEGKFCYLFSAEDLKKDEEAKEFLCPHGECTKRKRNRKTFSSHMGIAHRHTAVKQQQVEKVERRKEHEPWLGSEGFDVSLRHLLL